MNLCIFVGNIGKKPELRYTPSGKAVTTLSVATNRTYKDESGKRPVDWHNVDVWEQQAELCAQYLDKGSKVSVKAEHRVQVTGEGENRKYFDKFVAIPFGVEFLGGSNGASPQAQVDEEPVAEEEIPF